MALVAHRPRRRCLLPWRQVLRAAPSDLRPMLLLLLLLPLLPLPPLPLLVPPPLPRGLRRLRHLQQRPGHMQVAQAGRGPRAREHETPVPAQRAGLALGPRNRGPEVQAHRGARDCPRDRVVGWGMLVVVVGGVVEEMGGGDRRLLESSRSCRPCRSSSSEHSHSCSSDDRSRCSRSALPPSRPLGRSPRGADLGDRAGVLGVGLGEVQRRRGAKKVRGRGGGGEGGGKGPAAPRAACAAAGDERARKGADTARHPRPSRCPRRCFFRGRFFRRRFCGRFCGFGGLRGALGDQPLDAPREKVQLAVLGDKGRQQ
jgi:hypothetical protein